MADHSEFINRIQAHSGIIFKVIHLYIDDPEDQKDLHQEILLQAWKSYPNFAGRSSFSTWLYRVSLNTVMMFRRKKKAQTVELDPDLAVAARENPDRSASETLWQSIKALAESDRSLISLDLDGDDHEAISDIIGISTNYVGVKLHRIKKRLTQMLEQATT